MVAVSGDGRSSVVLVECGLALAAIVAVLYPSTRLVSLVTSASLACAFGFALGRGRSRATVLPLLALFFAMRLVGGGASPFALLVPGVAILALMIPIVRLVLPLPDSNYNYLIAAAAICAGVAARNIVAAINISIVNGIFIYPITACADAAFAGWLIARPPRLQLRSAFAAHATAGVTLFTVAAALLIAHSPLSEIEGLLLPVVAASLVLADSFESIAGHAAIRTLYAALIVAAPTKLLLDHAICSSESKLKLLRFLCRCGVDGACTGTSGLFLLPALLLFGVLFFFSVQTTLESTFVSRWPDYVEQWPNMPYVYTEAQGMPKRDNGWIERCLRLVAYYGVMFLYLWAFLKYSSPMARDIGRHVRNPLLCSLPDHLYGCDGKQQVLQQWSDSWSFKMLLNFCRIVSLISVPALLFNLVGQIAFPPANKKRLPSMQTMLAHAEVKANESVPKDESTPPLTLMQPVEKDALPLDIDFVLYFRYVTRGNSPELVLENCRRATRILRSSGLPDTSWRVEVVTDNAISVGESMGEPNVYEIVVPPTYKPPNGCLYKARALQYAIDKSPARDLDWIIHLDEETQFDADTVATIVLHCGVQTHAVRVSHKLKWPSIGQGLIVYGRAILPTLATTETDRTRSWTTTLADSARVGDDCGRFRMQYECGEVWWGMHGSFVVCANVIEKEVTFDHGIAGSIAEDAYFALKARSLGVRFAWIDGMMYEQSPFSFIDFVRQRARWLVGGMLVVHNDELPLWVRYVMGSMSTLWAAMPLTYLAVFVAIVLGSLEKTQSTIHWGYQLLLPASFALLLWSYMFGFVVTFAGQGLGVARFLALLYMQFALCPLFGVMELCGVVYALVNFRTMSHTFHVVQKQARTKAIPADEDTPLLQKPL